MTIQKPLETELETYQKNKSRLVSESANKYVLIKGEEIIGIFESHDDAVKDGYQNYGSDGFLVKQILDIEPRVNFFSNHLAL